MDTSDRFALLYERHHRRVFAYCLRRASADRADDAVAETFMTAWRRIDDIPEGDGALPWLLAVAFRVLGHQWRGASRRSRLAEKLAATGVVPVPAPEDYIVVNHDSEQILEALSRLKVRDQEILRLSIWEELNHAEIALILGVSEEAIRKRLSRARKSLAHEYDRLEHSVIPAAQEGGAS